MTADELIVYVTWTLFVIVFIATTWHALRQPTRTNLDIALFFGAASFTILTAGTVAALGIQPPHWLNILSGALVTALPLLTLRLAYDFAGAPRWLMRAGEVAFVVTVAAIILVPDPLPGWLAILLVLYFFGLETYGAVAFVREAHRSNGLTRRRMQAVAAGSLLVGLTILLAGVQIVLPALAGLWTGLSRVFALASGIAYFVGFAPPGFLRRAWQEPELRAFLARAASLPRLPDTPTIVREIARGAAASLGAPSAAVGLWDEAEGVLRYHLRDGRIRTRTPEQGGLAGRAFLTQQALLSNNAPRDDPRYAERYRAVGATTLLVAPVSAGGKRLGVLVAYGPRASIFADDDLVLVQLLADQAAAILESRALIDEAARVQAREEATRLKDDFLSAAAHDLKTPLTTLVAQAQLLERKALRDPQAPPDVAGIQRLIEEARRLSRLVLELLDASRVDQARIVGARAPLDLVAVAEQVCARRSSARHPCILEGDEHVVGVFDPARIEQLLENLVENAIKYSPEAGEIRLHVSAEGSDVRLTVTDQGIGMAAADLSTVFDRYQRGANVDDRRFAGMGLGLYICKGIVEQHGGRIWATSPGPGQGSTFHVVLPTRTATTLVA